MSKFQYFFDCCVGKWQTERTYHYLSDREVERSRTEFDIVALPTAGKVKVLADNQRETHRNIENLCGYHLAFDTVSEKGERVSQSLNMLFVPTLETEHIVEGDYLRDRAYEEAKPIVAHFRFDTSNKELLMTTYYTRVVSVDSITLLHKIR